MGRGERQRMGGSQHSKESLQSSVVRSMVVLQRGELREYSGSSMILASGLTKLIPAVLGQSPGDGSCQMASCQ